MLSLVREALALSGSAAHKRFGEGEIMSTVVPDTYELLFATLEGDTRGIAFPCDAQGHVDLDALSDSSRNTYFYARAVIGRVFARPAVQRRRTDHADRIEADLR